LPLQIVVSRSLLVGVRLLLVGSSLLLVVARLLLVGARLLLVGARLLLVDASLLLVDARLLLVDASLLLVGPKWVKMTHFGAERLPRSAGEREKRLGVNSRNKKSHKGTKAQRKKNEYALPRRRVAYSMKGNVGGSVP
jgi:hypothetical protein